MAIREQWRYEMGYDTAWVTTGDGTISVDGAKVRSSLRFQRDPRLHMLANEEYQPSIRRGKSRPEITHITVIPLDKDGKPMRLCSTGHYAPRSAFGKRTRNQYHGDRDGLDDICGQCRKVQRTLHRLASRTG